MLRLSNDSVKIGTRIILPEKWHDKLLNFSKVKNYPYEMILTETIKKKRETYYVCVPEKQPAKNKKIAFTEHAIKYLLADEVPDSNIGFSFKEYLPVESTLILLTNVRNPSELVPGTLTIETELVELNEESIVTFAFKIYYINGIGFSDVRDYVDGSKKSTWKFIRHKDLSYMTDYEQTFVDTIIHKSHVKDSVEKFARYLEKEGAVQHAQMLRERALIHDDSKLSCIDELHALSRIIHDQSTMHDASKQLSDIKKDSIALHHKNNSHHPEHYKSPMDMTKLDIMEMCCDWYARSVQKGTNFMEYVKTAQKERFHFPDWMFAEILHYCKVLNSDI